MKRNNFRFTKKQARPFEIGDLGGELHQLSHVFDVRNFAENIGWVIICQAGEPGDRKAAMREPRARKRAKHHFCDNDRAQRAEVAAFLRLLHRLEQDEERQRRIVRQLSMSAAVSLP